MEKYFDVVAVVLDAAGVVKYVLSKYKPNSDSPVATPASEFASGPWPMLWTYPMNGYVRVALRFRSDYDLSLIPPELKTPGGTATFMDTADYEAWVVMLRLAEGNL